MHRCWRIGMLCKTGITVVLGMGVPSCPTPAHMSLVRTWLQVFPRVLFSSPLRSRPYGWLVQQKVLRTLGSFLDLWTILNFGPIDNMPKLSSNEISNTSFFFSFSKGSDPAPILLYSVGLQSVDIELQKGCMFFLNEQCFYLYSFLELLECRQLIYLESRYINSCFLVLILGNWLNVMSLTEIWTATWDCISVWEPCCPSGHTDPGDLS